MATKSSVPYANESRTTYKIGAASVLADCGSSSMSAPRSRSSVFAVVPLSGTGAFRASSNFVAAISVRGA